MGLEAFRRRPRDVRPQVAPAYAHLCGLQRPTHSLYLIRLSLSDADLPAGTSGRLYMYRTTCSS